MTSRERMKALISDLANDLRKVVAKVEGGPQLTQNHYGAYLGIITRYDGETQKRLLALALMEAGANKAGVTSAINLAI